LEFINHASQHECMSALKDTPVFNTTVGLYLEFDVEDSDDELEIAPQMVIILNHGKHDFDGLLLRLHGDEDVVLVFEHELTELLYQLGIFVVHAFAFDDRAEELCDERCEDR
jgi:hypothetical protein